MIVFISSAVGLTLLALVWLLRPLLWNRSGASEVSTQRLNAAIYRDQLEALERDVSRGAMSAADFEATRDELQMRLLDDTREPDAVVSATGRGFWNAQRTALALCALMPLCAVGMYAWLGNPAALSPAQARQAQDDQVQRMLDSLVAKLKANPNNPKGWAMLARSYKVMGRFDEAEAAFAKVGDLLSTEPDVMVEYADLLGAKAGNSLEGRPLELVHAALKLDPKHPMALMMLGAASYNRGDFKAAVSAWERLLAGLEPGSPDALQVQGNIDDAQAQAKMLGGAKPADVGAKAAGAAGAATGSGEAGKLPPVNPAAAAGMTPEKINQMVEGLAQKLKANPGDLEGWVRLARAYKVQGKLLEAEDAFGKAGKLVDTNADLLAQYADLVAMRTQSLQGKPTELANKALAINGKHPIALMLSATSAFQRADYATAIRHWETVLTVLPPNSPDANLVKQELADARARQGGGKGSTAPLFQNK